MNTRPNKIIKIILLPLFLAILIKSINIFSFYCADKIKPIAHFIDEENAFLSITIHHIVQGIIGIALIIAFGIVKGLSSNDFGFTKSRFNEALKPLSLFVVIWTFVQVAAVTFFVSYLKQPINFAYSLKTYNILGHLLFQLFLSGPSEELLFRVIVMSFSISLLKNDLTSNALKFYTIIVSTFIFMFDHINFSLWPLKITYFNTLQQLTLLVFGVFYGWLFYKYRNYWVAALAHSILNVIIILSGLLVFSLTQ